MTAQATTAENANANATAMPEANAHPAQTATARPQSQANPTAGTQANGNTQGEGENTPDLDTEIQRAEKRLKDKVEHLEELKEALKNHDRQITDHHKRLKAQNQQALSQAPEQNAEPPANSQGDFQQQAARELGISDADFVRMLSENNGHALQKLSEVIERRTSQNVLAQIPQLISRQRHVEDAQAKVMRIRDELGDEGFAAFRGALHQYQQQGYAPTPDQLRMEVEFGPVDTQRKLMELGREYLRMNAEQGATQLPETQAQTQQTGIPLRRHPMAPGGGGPAGPQPNTVNSRGNNVLAGIGWHVGG